MDKKIIFYIIIGIIIVSLTLVTLFPNMIYAIRDSGQSESDICSPPEGQSIESWREHMSHHPNMYKDCLG